MSETSSSKSLALLVENNVITYLTQSLQNDEAFYSEPVRFEYNTSYKDVSYDLLLGEIKSQLPLLLYYNHIKVVHLTSDVRLIPKAYLSNSNENPLNDFYSKDGYQNNRLKNIDANFSFKINQNLKAVFNSLPNFKDAKYFHIGESLINQPEIDKHLTQIFVRIINQNLELCIYKNGEFYLYNIVEQNAEEDVVYYIINTIQQLGINPTSVEVIFDYGITENHKALEYLPKFVKNVKVNSETEEKDFKYILYNLFECE